MSMSGMIDALRAELESVKAERDLLLGFLVCPEILYAIDWDREGPRPVTRTGKWQAPDLGDAGTEFVAFETRDEAIAFVWGQARELKDLLENDIAHRPEAKVRACRICGCTDRDCRECIERTGTACHWVAPDLCSACVASPAKAKGNVDA
jgi:hypothetical protein